MKKKIVGILVSTLLITTIFPIGGGFSDTDKNEKTNFNISYNKIDYVQMMFGDPFTRVTEGVIVDDPGGERCGAWGDYNGDSFIDFHTFDQNLYRNNGDGTFRKITDSGIDDYGVGIWIDYNNDGYLDLFLRNQHGQAHQ